MSKQTTSDEVVATFKRVDAKIQTMAVSEAAAAAACDILADMVARVAAGQSVEIDQVAAAFNRALRGEVDKAPADALSMARE